ncbi:MAG TPA: hypothetical protein VFT74_06835, partial [Isosphaeraceae bacterium]|nr:hypothetical protein [Isosphaeraceae bacterium]
VLAVSLVLFNLPFGWDETWIDEVTGSRRVTARSFVTPTYVKSERITAVERRIVEVEGAYRHRWRLTSRMTRNVFGLGIAIGCGRPPQSFRLQSVEESTVRDLSRGELEKFVQTMRTGTPEEKETAVNALVYPYAFSRSSQSNPRG